MPTSVTQPLPPEHVRGNIITAKLFHDTVYILTDYMLLCRNISGPIGLMCGHPNRHARNDGPTGMSKLRQPRDFCFRESTGEVILLEFDSLRVITPHGWTSTMKTSGFLGALSVCSPKDDHYCVLSREYLYMVGNEADTRNLTKVDLAPLMLQHTIGHVSCQNTIFATDQNTIGVSSGSGLWSFDCRSTDPNDWVHEDAMTTTYAGTLSSGRICALQNKILYIGSLSDFSYNKSFIPWQYDIPNLILQVVPSSADRACLLTFDGEVKFVHIIKVEEPMIHIIASQGGWFFDTLICKSELAKRSVVFADLVADSNINVPHSLVGDQNKVTFDENTCKGVFWPHMWEVLEKWINNINIDANSLETVMETVNPLSIIATADFLKMPLFRMFGFKLLREWSPLHEEPYSDYWTFLEFAHKNLDDDTRLEVESAMAETQAKVMAFEDSFLKMMDD